ncbi:Aste57867_17337 [Aphanomyces stellatus]|nr:hypothetical protein As57867_017278 [Aphanomyces stellatus]VFT94093.1 Aste57867_17337 [Aphanomyces stellatus]
MEKRRVMETTSGSGIRACKRHFCGHCILASPTKPPRVIPRFLDDEEPTAADPRPYALSTLSSLDLSEYSFSNHNQHNGSSNKSSLPILDFDSDDEGGEDVISIYSGLDFDMRSTVQSHLDDWDDLHDRGSDEVQEAEPTLAKLNASAVVGSQLAQLTARMDDTLSLLRRNKTQIDFCRSHGRVEYL